MKEKCAKSIAISILLVTSAALGTASCATKPAVESCEAQVDSFKQKMSLAGLSTAPDPRTLPQPSTSELQKPPNPHAWVTDRNGRIYNVGELMQIREEIRMARSYCKSGNAQEAMLRLHIASAMLALPQNNDDMAHPGGDRK